MHDPAEGVIAVTPSDGTDLGVICRALHVSGAGNVTLRASDNSEATFASVPAGSVLAVRTRRVLATGTTATGIVGLY